jgi:lipid-binding SYLF domain-containing protein
MRMGVFPAAAGPRQEDPLHSRRFDASRGADVARASGQQEEGICTRRRLGFQAGIEVSETMTLVMTEKGMNSLLASSVKLGGDASVAAGPVGAGANSDIATDFVAFSRSKGVYGGLNLEGSVVAVADNWNRSYYGSGVLPPDILVKETVHNPQADRLAAELSRASSRRVSSIR